MPNLCFNQRAGRVRLAFGRHRRRVAERQRSAQRAMRPSRKRWLLYISAVISMLIGGWFSFSAASPLNRRSAIRTTLEWARFAPFPVPASSLHVQVSGSMLTRQFRISFAGVPQKIQEWLDASPGTRDLQPLSERHSAGWLVYSIDPARGMIAEVHLSPDMRQVMVLAVWS